MLELQEWAADALADEDLVLLDTETCVVELTVISGQLWDEALEGHSDPELALGMPDCQERWLRRPGEPL